jgi:two-component system, NtrC family, sensor kinase
MLSNRRILIVDDNETIHRDFRKILEGAAQDKGFDALKAELFGASTSAAQGSFELDSAFQGKAGLEKVEQSLREGRRYAVAFVDVRMPPGWDGIETTEKLWAVDPDLQIVICTAYSDYSWDEMIEKLGQSDRLVILKKPFDNVEVLQMANALSEKWSLVQQVKSKINDLEHTVEARTHELRASEDRFRQLCDFSPLGIIETDPAGSCRYANRRMGDILDRPAVEQHGTAWIDSIHPEDRSEFLKRWDELLERNHELRSEHRVLTASGSTRWVNCRAMPIFADGEKVGHVATLEDISEHKRVQQENQSMELQLRHAQKLEAIGQLAAGIAHEINTPTQYIGDNARFLKDACDDVFKLMQSYDTFLEQCKQTNNGSSIASLEAMQQQVDISYLKGEIPRAIQQSLDGIGRVSQIVQAMKEFSHPGNKEKTAVDLNHAIESTIIVARNEWKYIAEMVTELDPQLPPVLCLPGEINQVILNLIVNAAHAIGDVVSGGSTKGTITLSTKCDGDFVEIRVKDSGIGIPEAVRGRIFEPFFTTKGVGRGTGQGLAIARSVVVDKHGGAIDFETQAGQGTTFIIRLPVAPVPA